MHYLYRITNQANDKVYIGQTINPAKRWTSHKQKAKNPKHPIHHAIHKYGADNFLFDVIATCKTLEDADATEIVLIKQYNSLVSGNGYNLEGGGYGHITSEETKAKMSAAKRGKPGNRRSLTDEQEQALCGKYLDKISGHALAEEYGIKPSTVYGILRRHDIQVREAPPPINDRGTQSQETREKVLAYWTDEKRRARRKLTLDQEQEILALHSTGLGCDRIGKQLSLSSILVWRTLQRYPLG